MSKTRLEVKEAAQILGITPDAVHKRVRRGTLESEKEEDGRVYVWLDSVQPSDQSLIVERLENEVEFLRRELEIRNEELRRREEAYQEEKRRIDALLMTLTQRIPAIEPPTGEPPDASESPVTASEEEGKGQAPPEPEKAESEPWWRRIFR